MTRPPCIRVPDWWDVGDDGNRLALRICFRCPLRSGSDCRAGSPDPQPHGVIRAGVAYSDAGTPLPECRCGYPQTNYVRGGSVPTACPWCAVPGTAQVAALVVAARGSGYDEGAVERLVAGEPPAGAGRGDRREAMRRLWAAGLTHREVAARLRMDIRAVRRAWHRTRAVGISHQTVRPGSVASTREAA